MLNVYRAGQRDGYDVDYVTEEKQRTKNTRDRPNPKVVVDLQIPSCVFSLLCYLISVESTWYVISFDDADTDLQPDMKGTLPDGVDMDSPHIMHKPHDPFPIVMINRKPRCR